MVRERSVEENLLFKLTGEFECMSGRIRRTVDDHYEGGWWLSQCQMRLRSMSDIESGCPPSEGGAHAEIPLSRYSSGGEGSL